MPELPGAAETPRQGLEAARGARVLTQHFVGTGAGPARVPPSPSSVPSSLGFRVSGDFPTPILFPSAAALTLGQFLTSSSSSPHLQPLLARCELHTLVSVVLPQDPSPGRAVPSARPEPPQPRCPRCASRGGGGRAGTQPGPACRCLPQPTAATRRLRLAQRREHAPGLVNCASH